MEVKKRGKDSMNQNVLDLIGDLKSYLEYLKRLGITEFPLSDIRNEKMIPSSVSPGVGTVHEGVLPYRQGTISQSGVSNLQEIRSELGNCQRCKLARTRRTLVFGEGNSKASLMLIGEGPGYDEDVQGKPFVGRAGQLLTKILQAIAIQRDEVYITNIIKCRPPQNRNPEPDEIESCYPFLLKQIQAIQPRIICALGTFAAQTLLKTDDKITSLRGRTYTFSGIQIFPTYHPAYLLRNPEKKREVWEDMKKIAKVLSNPL
jgi:DNA polymerase